LTAKPKSKNYLTVPYQERKRTLLLMETLTQFVPTQLKEESKNYMLHINTEIKEEFIKDNVWSGDAD
jgi:hypothetical protein